MSSEALDKAYATQIANIVKTTGKKLEEWIAIVNKSIAMKCINFLRKEPEGIHASVIGEVVDEHPHKVIMKSSIGGKRVVTYLTGEQLPRIC